MKATICCVLGLVVASPAQVLRTRNIPQTQDELHARVVALYSFHPASLSSAERESKSAEMDIFWDEMKARTDVTLPLLRTELRSAQAPGFFYTDGTELLLTLSKAAEDEQLAAQVLPRMDLNDTQPSVYFQTTHRLAADGLDVTAGALHMLDTPGFRVNVPQHAMTLDTRTALMYVLLTMREDLWVKAATDRLFEEKDSSAKTALTFALFYAQTNDADAALRRFVSDQTQPAQVREKASQLLDGARKSGKSLLPLKSSVAELRQKRRERLRAGSDEAMEDVQAMTERIVALRARGKG